jgi:hypothetical protein
MVKLLLKKQLSEIFRSYFYNAKQGKARSRVSTVGYFAFFAVLMVGVLGGMFSATVLGIFFVPLFFVLIRHRFRDTWSVGIGWNIHKEKFMSGTDLFQLLKLRASVGNPGNQNFSAYQAFTTYQFNGWMTNVFGAGVLISALGNPDLQWQNTLNYTVGTDIAMFDNRLNVTVDVFRKITDPLLAVITTPGSEA